ncbi:hypothetical protein ACWEN3_45000 [Streptomyces sp. NPDC004561]
MAQFTAADFPGIRFPAGTDLVQLLWWRGAAEVTDPLTGQPDPEEHWDYGWDMIPRACVLHPERLTEYPWHEELPAGLAERFRAWLDERDLRDDVSVIPGWKVGGAMSWATTDMPRALDCGECGAPLELFLQCDTYEYALGTWGPDDAPHRFWPLEERDLEPRGEEWDAARDPTGMTVGRGSHAGVFTCAADPRHPVSFFTQ